MPSSAPSCWAWRCRAGLVTKELSRQVEPIATTLLVPLFFAYSGLSTRLSLLWSIELLLLAVVVILIASVGKGICVLGSCTACRAVRIGKRWRSGR